MPRNLKRFYGGNDLHFVTFSCHRRLPLLGAVRTRDAFLRGLEATRRKYRLVVGGYVVMPEHVHLLLSEPEIKDLSTALKAVKQGVSRRILRRQRLRAAAQGILFEDGVPPRLWQPRFHDFNVWTEKKRIEKLRYMHRNPVKRGLVQRPEDWRWSSFRHYAYGERGPAGGPPLRWQWQSCGCPSVPDSEQANGVSTGLGAG